MRGSWTEQTRRRHSFPLRPVAFLLFCSAVRLTGFLFEPGNPGPAMHAAIVEIIRPTKSLPPPTDDEVFHEMLDCLEKSRETRPFHRFDLAPLAVREENYRELLEATAKWRKDPLVTHHYKGYKGPWIEHHFYQKFCCDRNLTDFGPFIPIFVPWLDIQVLYAARMTSEARMIFSLMRPDCLYITVSQSDGGMEELFGMHMLPPNLLILSGSGKGNIPTIMNMGPRDLIDEFTDEVTCSFVGSTSKRRQPLINKLKERIDGFVAYEGPHWRELVEKTKINLVPRGEARGTFRYAEILQMGGIPAITWTDVPWIPYYGGLNFSDFAIVEQESNVDVMIDQILEISANPSELKRRRNVIRSLRDSHFTVEGSMNQVGLLMKGGFKWSSLRCQRHEPMK